MPVQFEAQLATSMMRVTSPKSLSVTVMLTAMGSVSCIAARVEGVGAKVGGHTSWKVLDTGSMYWILMELTSTSSARQAGAAGGREFHQDPVHGPGVQDLPGRVAADLGTHALDPRGDTGHAPHRRQHHRHAQGLGRCDPHHGGGELCLELHRHTVSHSAASRSSRRSWCWPSAPVSPRP